MFTQLENEDVDQKKFPCTVLTSYASMHLSIEIRFGLLFLFETLWSTFKRKMKVGFVDGNWSMKKELGGYLG